MRARRNQPARDPADARCRLCGSGGDLSFEHVPPRTAGNADTAWLYGLESFLAREQPTGRPAGRALIQQRGSGVYSLCRACNALAGARYVPEYLEWVRLGRHVLSRLKPSLSEIDAGSDSHHVRVHLDQARVGRFLKQVVTLLLALSPGNFAAKNPELCSYARDPVAVGLPGDYQLYLALYAGPIARYNGGAGRLYEDGHGGWASDYVLELAYPPFSYILSLEEDRPAVETACITNFAELGPDQRADVDLLLLVGFGHTPFPLDFRTHAMLARDRAEHEAGAA